ncbi:MAG: hypothetical protein ACREOI_37130 [bacterium]
MKFTSLKLIFVLSLLLMLGGGCSYDHGLDPVPSRIKGMIIFEGGPPPFYVREARLVVAKKVPPENFTTDVILSDPLPFNRDTLHTGPDTVRYEVVVEPGTYAITALLWRREGQAWSIANILGLYGVDFTKQEFTPKEVVINSDRPVADSVDVRAYWLFTRRDASISGTINFKGAWRADTDFFVLGFYSEIPRSQFDYLNFSSFLFVLQRAPVASYTYSAAVNSGKYKFIALFWKGKTSNLADIRAIGFYRCAGDSLLPANVETSTNMPAAQINFDANFAALPGGIRFSAVENCGQP